MPKPITVEDYKEVADDFFDKFNFGAERLPDGASAEDIIKIMQNLSGLVVKKRAESFKFQKRMIGFMKEECDA